MTIPETVKNYWGYNDIKKLGYNVRITKRECKNKWLSYNIHICKGKDKYASFEIREMQADELSGIMYWVYDKQLETYINEDMDFTSTLEECINGCLYQFLTRY